MMKGGAGFTVPDNLILHEPDMFMMDVSYDHPDSGILLSVGDSSARGLSFCALALSANQTIALLEGFKKIEALMRNEIAQGRGGRDNVEFVLRGN